MASEGSSAHSPGTAQQLQTAAIVQALLMALEAHRKEFTVTPEYTLFYAGNLGRFLR